MSDKLVYLDDVMALEGINPEKIKTLDIVDPEDVESRTCCNCIFLEFRVSQDYDLTFSFPTVIYQYFCHNPKREYECSIDDPMSNSCKYFYSRERAYRNISRKQEGN